MRNTTTVKQLQLLSAAARGGSFASAAEACHVTPPAVTMQMHQLEADIGLPLFERDGWGFAPGHLRSPCPTIDEMNSP